MFSKKIKLNQSKHKVMCTSSFDTCLLMELLIEFNFQFSIFLQNCGKLQKHLSFAVGNFFCSNSENFSFLLSIFLVNCVEYIPLHLNLFIQVKLHVYLYIIWIIWRIINENNITHLHMNLYSITINYTLN